MKKYELTEMSQIPVAIGVITSLIHLGRELRRNSNAFRAQTSQGLIDSSRNVYSKWR